MLTKVFPTGQGKGYGPVEYLCAANPFGRGEREKAPQVISGNPALIKSQIDAVPFRHKYTSGVHSFAPEDKPTDEQIMEVIEATEELAFGGLPLSSRSILWVKHEHAGRTELHFLIPRQEVNSGKSFNAFPPGWQQKYDPLRDKFNYKYGWARPDDPERARHWQPGINAKIMKDAKRQVKPNPKAEVFSLTDDLANMAIQGKLANRSDIVSELRRRGYGINRQGKDYLTIIDQNGKKTRLKGTLFEENFNGPDWRKAQLVKIDKPDSEKLLIDLKLAEEADAKLQEAIRKSAQYNINRYSLREEENEQSAGKQPDESALEQGRTEKTHGVRFACPQGAMAAVEESTDRKADETTALHSQQGLGTGAKNGGRATAREDAQSALREIPLPEQPFSGLGGGEGTGSAVERRNREAVEYLYGWSNRGAQGNIGTGAGNTRGKPGKPGGYDETDYGQPERTARQSFQPGDIIQDFRSLKKSTEKLEDRLAQLNQEDKKLPDFELGLHTSLENMDLVASQVINGLRQANEARFLRSLVKQSIRSAPIDTDNLLITGYETVKWLRAANEQKLLQKLAKSGSPLVVPDLEEFSFLGNTAQHNLSVAHDIKYVADLPKVSSILYVPELESLKQGAKLVYPALRMAAEFRQLEQLELLPVSFETPQWQILESEGKKTYDSLRKANDFPVMDMINKQKEQLILPNLSRFATRARFTTKRLQAAHETRILTKIFKSERQRRKIIKNCYFHAEWAGSDLRRWDMVIAEYEKSPKKLKILESMIDSAHCKFALILSDTQNLAEIQNRCGNDPFLQHEYGILRDKVEQYYIEKREKEMEQTEVENPKFEDGKTEEFQKPVINFYL